MPIGWTVPDARIHSPAAIIVPPSEAPLRLEASKPRPEVRKTVSPGLTLA